MIWDQEPPVIGREYLLKINLKLSMRLAIHYDIAIWTGTSWKFRGKGTLKGYEVINYLKLN